MRTIPKKFDLMGHTIEVHYSPTLVDDFDAYGISIFARNTIMLQTPNRKYTRSHIMQTFWHEVSHFMMYYMGEEDLNHNEKFVDLLGQCLHQVNKTARAK